MPMEFTCTITGDDGYEAERTFLRVEQLNRWMLRKMRQRLALRADSWLQIGRDQGRKAGDPVYEACRATLSDFTIVQFAWGAATAYKGEQLMPSPNERSRGWAIRGTIRGRLTSRMYPSRRNRKLMKGAAA